MTYEAAKLRLMTHTPSYIQTLLATDFIHCEVRDENYDPPTMAWTTFDEAKRRWKVCFRPVAATLSDEAITLLWRHEIGHIVLAHFVQEVCEGVSPERAFLEQLEVGDIQINTYLLDEKPVLQDIGARSKEWFQDYAGREVSGPGYLDPEKILPEIGLEVKPYSFEIIHAFLHAKKDEQEQEALEHLQGLCGGIEQLTGDARKKAEAAAAIVSMISTDKSEKDSEQWGGAGLDTKINLPHSDLPPWLPALERFARSIVQIILTDRRTHSRPQEIYRKYGVHVPTQRPRWSYKEDQICFLVDTSGSMMDELKYVLPVVQYLNQHEVSVRLIAGDTRVTFDELLVPGGKLPEAVRGGGGTEITPLFDAAYEHKPRSIVCFTDGYVPKWPTDTGISVLWVGLRTEAPYGIKA